MKPFPGYHAICSRERLFNQKLSSSRVAVENAFVLIPSVFIIFKKPIPLNADKASLITMKCVLLQNFFKKVKYLDIYIPPKVQ
nr:unnamed protein product [Callosobruchus analis]